MNSESKQKVLHPSRHQSGLSLIELMISMVVGLFLLAGVVTNFIATTKSDSKREAVSEMDANAVLAFEYLRRTISHAGYPSMENTPMETPFYTVDRDIPNPDSCGDGSKRDFHTIEKNRRTHDEDTDRDYLMVVSLADNPCVSGATRCDGPSRVADINPAALVYTDCNGGGALRDRRAVACSTDPDVGMDDSRDAKIYSAFWLKKYHTSPEDRTLYCEGNRGGSQPIVKDVEAIQYLYGVRDAAGNTNYRNATQVESLDQWPMVTSVQVGLLMRSSNQYVLDKPSTKTRYNLLKQNIDIHDRDKRRLFRVYTTTINLENRK